MKDFMSMMGKVNEMQARMSQVQEELENTIVQGSAGGDMVQVSMSVKGTLKGIRIDPSLLNPDEGEILEDLVIAAHGDAMQKAEAARNEKIQEITAGLPIPPGMKLPF